ncbi:hypothetical protein MASR2M78_08390 [Treponema sp.]
MEARNDFLLESTSYYDVLEQMRDGIFIVDREYTIHYWNPAAASLLGYPAGEVCSWSCASLGSSVSGILPGTPFAVIISAP